jgi:hypothetical protein
MYQWLGFAVGIVLGASVGLIVAALCRAAKEQEFPDVIDGDGK